MKWREMKKKMTPLEMCRTILRDYVICQSYDELSKMYDVGATSINNFVMSWKTVLEKAYPNLWANYRSIVANKRTNYEEELDPAARVRMSARVNIDFNEIPKVIKYNDFLKYILKHETGQLTGNDLVKIARSKGIKVIG